MPSECAVTCQCCIPHLGHYHSWLWRGGVPSGLKVTLPNRALMAAESWLFLPSGWYPTLSPSGPHGCGEAGSIRAEGYATTGHHGCGESVVPAKYCDSTSTPLPCYHHRPWRGGSIAGLKATLRTRSLWPRRVCCSCPVLASHTFTVESALAVARRVPSGLKATTETAAL